MLENYIKLENSVVKQLNYNKIIYDIDYVKNRYDHYGEKTHLMSHLRYGYLIGSIKNIPDSILDVGYGNCDFLKLCQKNINNCYGNDVSSYPLPEGITFVDDITENFYEVICFFDSLEHFDDISIVKDLKCKYIFISVPNCHYIDDEWFSKWKHRRPNEHLYHFNNESLTIFMKENGFELLNTSNIEDIIRIPVDNLSNILTNIYIKI